ncbi:MAG: stage 0 sporulation protein [Lentisphaeria bacterium]|nr:stage 0 sporulation protein [Lentisphaeria bacterium]
MCVYLKVVYSKGVDQDCQASAALGLKVGDYVVVDNERYQDIGEVVAFIKKREAVVKRNSEMPKVLNKVEKPEKSAEKEKRIEEVFQYAKEEIKQHKLGMKLIKTHISSDQKLATFLFIAEARVDFRLLVKSLSRRVGSRIELRQVGVRDETAIIGGFGSCGQQLCCSKFLNKFQSINVKIVKDQGLPLTPSSITGVCGRLKCCLKFEHKAYVDTVEELPKIGAKYKTEKGQGKVVGVNVLKHSIMVKLFNSNNNGSDEIEVVFKDKLITEKCGTCSSDRQCSGRCRK